MSGYRTLCRAQPTTTKPSIRTPIWDTCFLPSSIGSTLIFASCHSDGIIRLYSILQNIKKSELDAAKGTSFHPIQSLVCKEEEIKILGWSKLCLVVGGEENKQIVVGAISLNGRVNLWIVGGNFDEQQQEIQPVISFQVSDATGTSFVLTKTPYSEIFCIVGCRNGGITLFRINLSENKIQQEFHYNPSPSNNTAITSLACNDNNLLIAAGHKDGTIDTFTLNIQSKHVDIHRTHKFTYHENKPVRALNFTKDGALLLSGGDDSFIHMYDVVRSGANPSSPSSSLVGSILGVHKSWILNIQTCPTGQRFATSCADTTIRIWDIATRQNLHTFDDGHETPIWCIGFCDDGKRLISADEDGVLQLYSTEE